MDALEEAGLTKNEAKIYRSLLNVKSCTVTELSRRTGIHRRSVYDVLVRLSEKGIVSFIVSEGTKKYMANSPETIATILKSKQEKFMENLPKLNDLFKSKQERKSTEFMMGKKGIRNILNEQLRTKEEILVLGASKKADKILLEFFPKYHFQRIANKIPMKIIYSGETDTRIKKEKLCKIKEMPENLGGKTAINIYGNNVAIILWTEDAPFVILIKQKEIADSFRDYFSLIWNGLKP